MPTDVRGGLDQLAAWRAANRAGDFRDTSDKRRRPDQVIDTSLRISPESARELLLRRRADADRRVPLTDDRIRQFCRGHELVLLRLATAEVRIKGQWMRTGFSGLDPAVQTVIARVIARDLAFYAGFNDAFHLSRMMQLPALRLDSEDVARLLESAPYPGIADERIWHALILPGNQTWQALEDLVGQARLKELGLSENSAAELVWHHGERVSQILDSEDPRSALTDALRVPDLNEIARHERVAADGWLAEVRASARKGGFRPGSQPVDEPPEEQHAFDRACLTHLQRLRHGVFVITGGRWEGEVNRRPAVFDDLPGVQQEMVRQRLAQDLETLARWQPDDEEGDLQSVALLSAEPSEIEAVAGECGRTRGEVWSALTLGFPDPAATLRDFDKQLATVVATASESPDVFQTRARLGTRLNLTNGELDRLLRAQRASLSERDETELLATVDALLHPRDPEREVEDGTSQTRDEDGGGEEDRGGGARRDPDGDRNPGGPATEAAEIPAPDEAPRRRTATHSPRRRPVTPDQISYSGRSSRQSSARTTTAVPPSRPRRPVARVRPAETATKRAGRSRSGVVQVDQPGTVNGSEFSEHAQHASAAMPRPPVAEPPAAATIPVAGDGGSQARVPATDAGVQRVTDLSI